MKGETTLSLMWAHIRSGPRLYQVGAKSLVPGLGQPLQGDKTNMEGEQKRERRERGEEG